MRSWGQVVSDWELKLVGTVRIQPRDGPGQSDCADVMVMFVRSDNQKQGIGRLLLETAIDKASKIDGLDKFELEVRHDNRDALARKFHKKAPPNPFFTL